jgi:hypothetical protein
MGRAIQVGTSRRGCYRGASRGTSWNMEAKSAQILIQPDKQSQDPVAWYERSMNISTRCWCCSRQIVGVTRAAALMEN